MEQTSIDAQNQNDVLVPEVMVDQDLGGGCNPGGPFGIRPDGVYFFEEGKNGEVNSVRVCSPLTIKARTRNASGQEWGILLEVRDPEGVSHTWAMPSRLMAGSGDSYRSELLSMGLNISSYKGKQRLDLYLSTARVKAFARCVDRIGWHGEAFVLPDAVYGKQAGEEIVYQGLPSENQFREKGTLDEWRDHVGRFCAGNTRLVLAVSAALAAALLEPLGAESGGLHLVGGSSLGKTTALRVAGSVCGGGPNGFIKQWRATDNGLEGIAAAHCDSLLCLDEMGQAGGKVVSEAAYMLANGQGKGRASRNGQARKVQAWRVLFLSTGEVTLSDKVAEEGKGRAKAGQAVRVVDIPADAGAGLGLFESLHGHENADQFARALKEASSLYYGTPLRIFLKSLVEHRNSLCMQLHEVMLRFEAANCPEGADGQVVRVCGRFALVAAAGELGVSLGVLPWASGEAFRAATACFQAWVLQRGGTGAAEVMEGLEQVRTFFQVHGSSRFGDLAASSELRIINRAGYRGRVKDIDAFMVFPSVFRDEVCRGGNVDMICAELKRSGILLAEAGRHTRNIRIHGVQHKMYVLASSILGGNTGNSGNALEGTGAKPFPLDPTSRDKREQGNVNHIAQIPDAPTDPAQHEAQNAVTLAEEKSNTVFPDRVTL